MQVAEIPMEARAGLDIEQLVRDHYDRVFRFCARRVGPTTAPDVAQETFLAAWQSRKSYRGEASASTWLLSIAFHQCTRALRKAPVNQVPWLDVAAGGEPAVEIRQDLHHALRRLHPRHREVVVMHELDGLTYAEAARLLGVPEGTVKSRLHHAFAQLRSMLGEEVLR